MRVPILGQAMRLVGYIGIEKTEPRKAIESINRAVEKIHKGASVLIFPEGTRNAEGRVQPFKKGGFVMAVDTGAPIVPVILRGSRSIMAKGSWRINSGNVILSIEKPIDTSGFTRETKEDLIKKVRGVICEVFEKGKKFDTSA